MSFLKHIESLLPTRESCREGSGWEGRCLDLRNIQQIAIKYLTYLVLNKRKLDNKQTPVPPTFIKLETTNTPLEPTSQRGEIP